MDEKIEQAPHREDLPLSSLLILRLPFPVLAQDVRHVAGNTEASPKLLGADLPVGCSVRMRPAGPTVARRFHCAASDLEW